MTFGVLSVAAMSMACNNSPQAREANFLRKGAALLQKADYTRALLEFKNASTVMPKDAEPYYQMAIAFLGSRNTSNSIAALRKATELNPHHERAQVALAELMAAATNKAIVREAAGRLENVLSASPNNLEANDVLALAEWKLGKTKEAIARLEETLRKLPSRLQTSEELARLNVAQGDFVAAEAVLKQAVAAAPQSSEAHLALGQLYMIASEPTKAEVELRKTIELDSKNGSAMLALAAIQIAGKRMEEAEQTYRRLSSQPRPDYKPLHAIFLFTMGKRDAALAEFENLAKQTPGDRGARDRLFAAYRTMGKNQSAQSLVSAALKQNSKDADALFQRAELSAEAGDLANAEQDLKEVLHFKSDSAEAHFALARIYKAQGLSRSMRQELYEALRTNPALLPARVAFARTLTLANEAKAALDIINAAPANQRRTLTLAVERNWALLSLGETKDLRAALDRELSTEHLPELLIQDAVLRCQQSDFSAARLDAEEVIQNNPQDVRAVRLLAESYILQKQPAKAEERLKAIVMAYPHSAPIANLLGEWYVSNNNPAGARRAFEAALSANPNFLGSALALADLDYREKNSAAARQRLLHVLTVDPKNVRALVMLGTIADEARNRQEAIARYRAALVIDDSNLLALNNLAYILALPDPDGALKYAQHAAELAPDNATVEDTLGWVFYRKAIYGSAVQYLEAAVAKDPTPRRQFHLAMSYMKFGDRVKGEKTLKIALQGAPDLIKTEEGW